MSQPLKPKSLRREGDGLKIEWSDGVTTFAKWSALRRGCPCASCRDVQSKPSDPFKVLSAKEVAAGPLQPTAMAARGHYAYQITWNDGHDSGIYSLDLLRSLSTPIEPPSSSS